MDTIGGTCSAYGEMGNSYSISVGKAEGNRQLGRSRRSWRDNVRTEFWEIGWEYVGWMCLA